MAISGGASNILGVDFQIWFTAYKLLEVLFDENIKIRPEAFAFTDSKTDETKETSIDDLVLIRNEIEIEFYNIKSVAPNKKDWNLTSLISQNVIEDFKQQYVNNASGILTFVSMHPCILFSEILNRAASCENKAELELKLKRNKYNKVWEKLKTELGYTDIELISFSKQIRFERMLDIDEIQKYILRNVKGLFTKEDSIPQLLYKQAVEASKQNKQITHSDLLFFLEKNGITKKVRPFNGNLIDKLNIASSNVSTLQDTFFSTYHLERRETQQLFDKINEKNVKQEDRIIVLSGIAGSGKSIIIKDLLNKLKSENIPVLALKADAMMYDSIEKLEIETNLTEGIINIVGTLAEQNSKVVILIDQIDALSQTMSKDRRALNTYLNLVSRLGSLNKVRIVISCREYDLQYEPSLKDYNRNVIKVSNLSDEDIFSILNVLKIQNDKVPLSLKNFLAIPLHLRIFCEVYNSELDLKSLETLQDLYDELWRAKIENYQSNELNLVQSIEFITEYFDKKKILYISEAQLDQFVVEKTDLLKKSILTLENRKIQFFHQSFFDYCYARSFIKKDISLISVILDQHQGLFVRSQIKQVLSYLRERLNTKYYSELYELLTNAKIRFHIWLLAVNFLASQEKLHEKEIEIVKQLISIKLFCLYFLDSVYTKHWLGFLIKQGYLTKFLNTKDKKLLSVLKNKLIDLVKIFPIIIIDFIFENKNKSKTFKSILQNVLWSLEAWDYTKAQELFNANRNLFTNNNNIYHFILERITKHNPKFVFNLFFKELIKKINKVSSSSNFDNNTFDYYDTQIFEGLMKWDAKVSLAPSLKIISKIIDKTKWQIKNNEYYSDSAFYSYQRFDRDLYEHWKWLSIIITELSKLAGIDKPFFLKLIKKYSKTKSRTLNRIILICYLENFEKYVNESFRLLMKKGFIEDTKENYYGAFSLRELINKIYPMLSIVQKYRLNNFMMTFEPKFNEHYTGERRKWKDYSKYELLGSIPNKEIKVFPEILKKLQELERKYDGKYLNEKTNSRGMFSVGPPLPEKAYDNMDSNQWYQSFLKYDDSTSWGKPKEDFRKGGIVEHSRAFASQVKNKPDYFYQLILQLANREEVSLEYLSAGLNGLVDAKYSFGKIKKIILLNWQKENHSLGMSIIKAIEYINTNNPIGVDLIKILENYSLRSPDSKEESWNMPSESGQHYYNGDALTSGINSVRGSAVYALGRHAFHTNHSKLLFEIFEKVAVDKSIAVRSCLLVHLNVMIQYNWKSTYNLFIRLTQDYHPQLIKYGMECIYFLMTKNNFGELKNHFKIGMKLQNDDGHGRTDEFVGQVLMLAYHRGYVGSKELLEEGFSSNENIKIGAIDFASRHLINSEKKPSTKCKEIYLRYLNDDSIKVRKKYGWEFQNFLPENFNYLYDIIKQFSLSNAPASQSHFYLEYLLKCCNYEPKKCIDLIKNYSKLEKPDIRYNMLEGKEIFNILMGAYNKLTDDKYKEKAMNILDNVMKESELYKRNSEKLIKELERI